MSAESASSSSAPVTTALPSEIARAHNWSRQNGVEVQFLWLADVVFLLERPASTGSILNVLKSDSCNTALMDWARENPAAEQLLDLSAAIRGNTEILEAAPPLSHGIKGIDVIRGQSDQLYLIGLLAARLPVGLRPDDTAWFEKLRLWLLVHASERASNGFFLDRNLNTICTALRLAHDSGGRWLSPFLELRVDAFDFQGMGYGLVRRAGHLLARKGVHPLSASEINALKALEGLIKGEVAEYPVPPHMPQRLLATVAQSIAARPFQLNEEPFEDAELEDRPARYVEIEGSEPSETVICTEVDPAETHERQALSGKTVLISSAEDNQFLPWSWKQCVGLEDQQVRNWVAEALAAEQPKTRLCAAILWVADATGRSVERSLEFRIGGKPGAEWHLDSALTKLVRLTPRPQRQVLLREDVTDWILPFASEQVIRIPEPVREALCDPAGPTSIIPTLGHLYDQVVRDSPRAVYGELLKDVAPRLSTAMFARSLPLRAFRDSGDAVLAGVIASSPRTGKTGAMSYASWPVATVGKLLDSPQIETAAAAGEENGMGSLINVRDEKLRDSLRGAATRVEEAKRGGDFLAFSNRYVAYHLIGLLAYTGARPITDCFEQSRYFDLVDGFVFVNDKVVDSAHEGRLVPVHWDLIQWVRDDYPRHLRQVAEVLRDVAPDLAQATDELTCPEKKGRLPFFFFLAREEGGIRWISVSEQSIQGLDLFDSPLPLNFFRHRIATELRKLGTDPETIDSLLGHSSIGGGTHGDLSWRVWTEDMQAARPTLDALFERTGFKALSGWDGEVAPVAFTKASAVFEPRIYGQDARAAERMKRHRQARRDAVAQINETLAGRTLDLLSTQELSKLAAQMVTTPKGMPHPYAKLRWACLYKRATRIWKRTGKRVRLNRAFAFADERDTTFTEAAPGARSLLEGVKQTLAAVVGKAREGRPGRSKCAAIAPLLLLAESRVSDQAVLLAASAGKGIRLITKDGTHFLEYSAAYANTGENQHFFESRDPGIPVRRYRVSADAVWLIERSLSGRNKEPRPLKQVPAELAPVADLLVERGRLSGNATYAELLEALASAVDQANQIELPGVLAGYLGGRLESYALEWFDWLLLRWGERRLIEIPPTDEDAFEERMVGSLSLPGGVREKTALQPGARKTFQAIRRIVDGAGLAESEIGLQVNGSRERKQQQASIREVLKHCRHEISSATQALALWVVHLLERKKGKDRLATNTVKRYFSALSGGFESLMYDVDLTDLDEEDVTELYQQLFESAEVVDKRYLADRLVMFHRWARRVYGMQDPDWSQLEAGSLRVSVDAGVLLEADYQNALARLLAFNPNEHAEARDAALLLLLCYRFGLRGNEARGLTQADCVLTSDQMVLIVRSNSIRKLKTTGSRRVVPLVFELEVQERSLIEERLMRAKGIHGDAQKGRIFCQDDGGEPDWAGVKRLAIAVLKDVTGNPGANLHRARHAAANRVMLALAATRLPEWSDLDGGKDSSKVAATLLGRTGPTRRAAWALARFLGHTNLKTGLRSYLHCPADLSERAFQAIHPQARVYSRAGSLLIDLDSFPLQDHPSENIALPLAYLPDEPGPSTLLNLMRLLALGKSAEQIIETLNLNKEWSAQALGTIEAVGKRLHLGPRRKKEYFTENNEPCPLEYLGRIRPDGWTRLLKAAAEVKSKHKQFPRHNAKTELLHGMVGRSGELLMARDEQFDLVRKTLNFWDIKNGSYTAAAALDPTRLGAADNDALLARAAKFGFGIEPAKSKKGNTIRVDFPVMDDYGSRARARCGVFLSESAERKIRNRIEFVVAFLAFALSSLDQQNDMPGFSPGRDCTTRCREDR